MNTLRPVGPVLLAPVALAAALATVLALSTPSVRAQTSPWYVGGAVTYAHENNLLRRADSEVLDPDLSRSDNITSVAALAGLDQPIGRQRLYGNATLRQNRFQNNGFLDNDSYEFRAGVDWATVDRLSGNIDVNTSRNLASFSSDDGIGIVTSRNIENRRSAEATVRLGVVTDYTLEASYEHRSVDYSAAAYRSRENSQDTTTLGLRWRPSGQGVYGIGLRHTRGRFPNFSTPDNGLSFEADTYQRTGIDFILGLEVGGASRIDARLTWGSTRYDQADYRDTSTPTGYVTWTWKPGAKLALTTRLSRDTGQGSYYNNNPFIGATVDNSRTSTVLRLGAEYAATAKTRLHASVSQSRRDLVRDLPAGSPINLDASGRDTTTAFTLGATWEPTRSLVFGCDLGQDRRTASGDLSLPYSAGRASCHGQIFLR